MCVCMCVYACVCTCMDILQMHKHAHAQHLRFLLLFPVLLSLFLMAIVANTDDITLLLIKIGYLLRKNNAYI